MCSTRPPRTPRLDLQPDDGHFEYCAVATNMALGLPALYAFVCGRGVQEKTFGELKGEFALDVVPTRHYGANSAWQQLSILAHNIARSFQLDTLATPKPRSRKRTYAYVLRSMRTLRFLLIARRDERLKLYAGPVDLLDEVAQQGALLRGGRMHHPARPSVRPTPRPVHRVRALIIAL